MKVYESELCTLYHADARDVLTDVATESLDLVLTDPPYGVEFESGARTTGFGPIANDTVADRPVVSGVLRECVRVVGQNRHLYVFGPPELLDGLKVSAVVPMVWDKAVMGMGNLASPWGTSHEPLSFCTSNFRHAGKKGTPNLPTRMRKHTVLRFQRPTGRKVRHPTEKPVPLLRELIESSSRQGETVLDPFCGSGSTAVAAIISGRKAIAIDIGDTTLALTRIKAAEKVAHDIRVL